MDVGRVWQEPTGGHGCEVIYLGSLLWRILTPKIKSGSLLQEITLGPCPQISSALSHLQDKDGTYANNDQQWEVGSYLYVKKQQHFDRILCMSILQETCSIQESTVTL